jgi:superfamily II DNA or RNA helicase
MTKKTQLREWQANAVRACADERQALVVATPGAGKTVFAAHHVQGLIARRFADYVIVVVPSVALISSWQQSWSAQGMELTSRATSGRTWPKAYAGVVMTYAKMANMLATFETWHRRGLRFAIVFDEIHHTADANQWGNAAQSLGEMASRILAMTGTPFRNDAQAMRWVRYDADGFCRPSFRYSYGDAVRDGVCRAVEFQTDDGDLHMLQSGEQRRWKISETSHKAEDISTASKGAYDGDLPHLQGLIQHAVQQLDEYRKHDPDAGCLFVCRPGQNDEDNKHVKVVSKLITNMTGERPVVVTHDEEEAHDKLHRFRQGTSRFLVSVRMVSEGIDIPRLRVLCLATAPQSRLLFHQLVGRVVRVEPGRQHDRGCVVMSKFPHMMQWAADMEQEAQEALREIQRRDQMEAQDDDRPVKLGPIALGATHEHAGAIYAGETIDAHEIAAAQQILQSDPVTLSGISSVQAAMIARKVSRPSSVPTLAPPAQSQEQETNTLRNKIGQLVNQWCAITKKQHKLAYTELFSFMSVKNMDDLCANAPMQELRKAITWVERRIEDTA